MTYAYTGDLLLFSISVTLRTTSAMMSALRAGPSPMFLLDNPGSVAGLFEQAAGGGRGAADRSAASP